MKRPLHPATLGWLTLIAFLVVTAGIYTLGLRGGYLFDDFPNIVDNPGVQPHDASVGSLVRSALSSPSSEFKRPLSSLSFAANFLLTGTDPYWMKLTNVVIHLLNGLLAFLLVRSLLAAIADSRELVTRQHITAALVAGFWLLLPINLTAVLYVVQRMESLANLFVLTGLIGYVQARIRMQHDASGKHLVWATFNLLASTVIGVLAKETAVMLPMYALVIEAVVFRGASMASAAGSLAPARDRRIGWLFAVILFVPMLAGLAWILPGLLRPIGWSTRDFTMGTRLLSEARIVVDYIGWTVIPTPDALSFYHDDFVISKGLFSPWTTALSIVLLCGLVAATALLSKRMPLAALGLGLYLAAHLLTGTILPLELVYEHRNYFASFGLMIAVAPLLIPEIKATASPHSLRLVRGTLLVALLVHYTTQLAMASEAWGSPLSLARELAARAPDSPRAQYELGRTYIILSRYDESSPFTALAYAPLERSAALPESTILPEQALIFLNARMHRPLQNNWWESLTTKLRVRKVGVQDESSLGALSDCMRQGLCDLPAPRMMDAYVAALSHPNPSARLLAMYSDFAWNTINDHALAIRMAKMAIVRNPTESAYRIGLINKLIAERRFGEAATERAALASLNVGGALNADLSKIDNLLGTR